MAIEIKLYQFSKKQNSAKRPGNDDLKGTFPCRLISPTSITSPSVDLVLPAGFSVKYVNYAYIQEFDRYYWISGWTYSAGLWIANMTVDALASWKNGIGRSVQHVTRSTNENEYLPDNIYPLENRIETQVNEPFNYSLGNINLYSGFYVLTVISNSTTVIPVFPGGESAYASFTEVYLITPAGLRILAFSLTGGGDFWQQILNGKYKIGDFVLSLKWCPFGSFDDLSEYGYYVDRIRVADQEISYETVGGQTQYLSGYKLYPSSLYYEKYFYFDQPMQHPQIESENRGKYLNYAPYSIYRMTWPPIGTVELDNLRLPDEHSGGVRLFVGIDFRSGAGQYYIIKEIGRPGIATHIADINPADLLAQGSFIGLVDIPVSSGMVDGLAIASHEANIETIQLSQWQTGLSGVASLFELDFSETASAGFKIAQQNIAKDLAYTGIEYARVPTYSSKGASGSTFGYALKPPYIESVYQFVAAENLNRGRPTMKNLQLSTIPGFIQVLDPVIELECTPGELAEIKSYMMGGFYFE